MFDSSVLLGTNRGWKKAIGLVFQSGLALIIESSKGFDLEKYKFEDLVISSPKPAHTEMLRSIYPWHPLLI